CVFFFFQAEDGIRDKLVTGVQTCALPICRVVIVGGGYIGLEVAAVMRGEGREVTVLEAEERVLKRVTGKTVSAFFDAFHRAKGVDIRLNVRATAIAGDERARSIVTSRGENLTADVVLVAAGARANDE